MILFDNIVEILDLADGDRRAMLLVVALDSRFIGRTPVDGDFLRHAVAADRFLEKAERGLLVSLRGQQKVNGLARLIHRAIEVIAQFIAVCSSSILAETLGYAVAFSSPSGGKRRVF